jgi:hypothetical protein
MRNQNTVEFLVIRENLYSALTRQGLTQPERLAMLNSITITQMRTLLSTNKVERLN